MIETRQDTGAHRPKIYENASDIALSIAVFKLVNQHLDALKSVMAGQLDKPTVLEGFEMSLKRRSPFSMDQAHYADPHNMTMAIVHLYSRVDQGGKDRLGPLVRGLKNLAERAEKDDPTSELAQDMLAQFLTHEKALAGLERYESRINNKSGIGIG